MLLKLALGSCAPLRDSSMSLFEALSLALSAAALLFAWWSNRQRRKESKRIDSIDEVLKDYQIRWHREHEAVREHAEITAELHAGIDRLFITNEGGADARAVDFELILREDQGSPLPRGVKERYFPAEKLEPGRSIELIAGTAKGIEPPFKIILFWTDPDGSHQRRETMLY